MADQAVAESSSLNRPVGRDRGWRAQLIRKARRSWYFARRWILFLLRGRRLTGAEVAEFVYGEYFFPAIQVQSELTALGEILAARRPERALEIGTAQGGTLLFLTRLASPRATIVSVDLPEGRFGGGYSSRRTWFYRCFALRRQQLHLLRGDSHSGKMLDEVKALFRERTLDYLFIDGDHSYEGVRRDFEMYGPLVGKGGIVAFHDIVDGPAENVGGVPQFWREVKGRYRHTELIKDPSQGGYGIGVLYVD